MRILLVHNHYRSLGGETVVFEAERDLLIQNGHTVETFTRSNETLATLHSQISAGIGYFNNRGIAKEFEPLLDSFKPDIVHAHNIFPIISPSVLLSARTRGIPCVMTLHNYRLICPNAMLLRNNKPCEDCMDKSFPWPGIQHACYADSFQRSLHMATLSQWHHQYQTWPKSVSRFIALSEFSKALFIKSFHQFPPEKISVKPNFIEDRGFSLEKSDTFLYVGRLSPEKGIDCLIKAFSESQKPLRIIGDGPLADDVLQASQNFPNIQFDGFQSRDTVFQALKQAKALIFPSIWYEGCPLTLLEALSCGTPIIGSHIGNIPEFSGSTALLFEPNNTQELNQHIQTIETDYRQRCQQARQDYERFYNPEVNYQKLIQIYEDVIHEAADT
jgi:glycosyltransferase involved in cell wall biosynthesis